MTDLIAAARSILARPQHHIMPEERIVATYILAAFPQVAEPSRDAADAEMEPMNFATHGARALVPIGARHILAEPSRAAVETARDVARQCVRMIERYQSERAEWDAHAGQWQVALDELGAEVERLTREMDETLAAVRATMSRLMDEREAAESALAAAPDDGADRVISDLLIASAPYADMDETGRLPKAREQAERLLNEPDLSAKQRYANHYEEQIGFLVERFAEALSSKLRKAEGKYQYQGAWRRDNWHDALVQQIRRHMDKGDPLDVAAYCAFAWHHGWTLAAPHTSAESALAAAQKRIAELEGALEKIVQLGDVNADEAPGMARAALAGGTAGDGEQVTQQQVARHQRRES